MLPGFALLRVVAMTAAACLVIVPVPAQSQPLTIDANIKAAFLSNFTKYVTWPPMDELGQADVRICVTESGSFFALLKSAIQGELLDGHPLVAVALDGLDDARTCQILYVGDSQSLDARAWLVAARNAQVLTVADGPLTEETVIAFVRDNNRIRFDINRAAASRHGLTISSRLLRLARRVRDQ